MNGKKENTYYRITGKRWFQRTYGNTYHSVKIFKISGEGKTYKEELIIESGICYGYGDHYLQTAFLLLKDRGLVKGDRFKREEIACSVKDVKTKRELEVN